MNSQELREARRALNWSRQQLAETAGLSVYQIAILEQGRRPATPEELESLKKVLRTQLEDVLLQSGEHPAIDVPISEEESRTGEWNGIRRGDDVRIFGEKGRFKFLFYYEDDNQEYAQVFGPTPGTVPRSRNPRAPQTRSFSPERVIVIKQRSK